MSPSPVRVNWPPDWWYPPTPGISGEPTYCPAHGPAVHPSDVARGSKTAVSWVGPPPGVVVPPPKLCDVWSSSGDAANRPACAVDGRPARVTVPTCDQVVPSAE